MRHLVIVGPTACAKSEIAHRAALQLSGQLGTDRPARRAEIVSLDSIQVYKSLDVGSAKVGKQERDDVPYWMLDVADPADDWSVAKFQRLARDAVAGIESRGNVAVLVGGTGLYVQAVIDDLRFPPQDLELRRTLELQTLDSDGLAEAYALLRSLDEKAALKIEPTNRRRIVRALEVIGMTGKQFSTFGSGLHGGLGPFLDVLQVGVWLPRDEIRRRIALRVDDMYHNGLVDEARDLPRLGRTAAQAIGYREALALIGGELSLEEAKAETVRRTVRFSRRQRMWFRRDSRIIWFGAEKMNSDSVETISNQICELWKILN